VHFRFSGVREARGCEVRVKLGGFTLLRPNTAAMSCCFLFWDGGESMEKKKFDFIVLMKNRELTSREEVLDYERLSGRKLNSSYVEFISEIGSGEFFSDEIAYKPVSSLKDAIEVTGWYSDVIVSDIHEVFNLEIFSHPLNRVVVSPSEIFIDDALTRTLKSATKENVFVYNSDSNDHFFSIEVSPETLFCATREGEIYLVPDGFYNLSKSLDKDGNDVEFWQNSLDFPKIFIKQKIHNHFSFRLDFEINLKKLLIDLKSRVTNVLNIYEIISENKLELADSENLYWLSVIVQPNTSIFTGFWDEESGSEQLNIESFLRSYFAISE
jgi:hypothetical protein